jgi:broad specificity phosphatase PhoE
MKKSTLCFPAEVVLVRHGQCTGNAADRASYLGDHSLFDSVIRGQKSHLWPLTQLGIEQSISAGDWIRKNIASSFDRYFTSDYVRSIETSDHFGFENSQWEREILLREREWGGAENLPYSERNPLFQEFGISISEDSKHWKPPHGESLATVTEKVKMFLEKMRTNTPGKKILLVSHGAPIQAFRVLQHKIDDSKYVDFINKDWMRNCHIFHYYAPLDTCGNIPQYTMERSVHLDPKGNWIETVQEI